MKVAVLIALLSSPLALHAQGLPHASLAVTVQKTDRNGDGVADSIVFFDSNGRKEREEFDFNYDGKMDDFLYYAAGVLEREEVDSNFDGKIDLWVYLVSGVYISKYERDLNADGVPEVIKDFGNPKK